METKFLRLSNGREVVLPSDGPVECGGYGVVRKGIMRGVRLTDTFPVAVKFLQRTSCRDANERKMLERRFDHEIKMLKHLNGLARRSPNKLGGPKGHWIIPQQFPRFIGNGVSRGRRFYVMEWLEPLDLRSLKTEGERVLFAEGLCMAVSWLHEMGFVHCDLKPANIMQRPAGGAAKYAFVDFGSIHKKEAPLQEGETRRNGRNTLSVDQEGARHYPHTPGYADPMYDRHTIYFDIYSIGQTLRDMFAEEVPVSWSCIINKCISHWWQYRYKSVDELAGDIGRLDEKREDLYWAFKRDFDRREYDRQISMGGVRWPSDYREVKWADILHTGKRPRRKGAVWNWSINEHDVCAHDASGDPVFERCFFIAEPLQLPPNVCLVLSGSFVLVAPIVGPKSAAVILCDGVCFHNPALQGSNGDRSIYIVTSRAYLNFTPTALGVEENTDEVQKSISARVFRSPHDATFVGFSGPGTWVGLRRRETARVETTNLPVALKGELSRFMSGENYGNGKDGFWRMSGTHRP